ncbi:Regulatory P domain of the subtilisin-like proprotein convertase [Balamuthia mandrillaris]
MRRSASSLAWLLALCVCCCGLVAGLTGPAAFYDAKDKIDGEYIVVLHDALGPDDVADYKGRIEARLNPDMESVDQVFRIGSFNALKAKLSLRSVKTLLLDEEVKYVQENQVVRAIQLKGESCSQQSIEVPWGLDRIDQRSVDLTGKFRYKSSAGQNVDAYIIDTGIQVTHKQFEGRAEWGTNTAGDGQGRDCHGHGTHVAGTVGSLYYGVAKKTTLIAVKVLACDGYGSDATVIAGVEWATNHHHSKQNKRPSVANMSLGGGFSPALNEAVNASITAGITYAVAAGNDDYDACFVSPASVETAITVGATEIANIKSYEKDARSYYSNYGSCLSVLAPGTLIKSTWIGESDEEVKTISGTSMASPHVAGVAALFLDVNPEATPKDVKGFILDNALEGKVVLGCEPTESTCPQTPNRLLYFACGAYL